MNGKSPGEWKNEENWGADGEEGRMWKKAKRIEKEKEKSKGKLLDSDWQRKRTPRQEILKEK